jgi:Protein of unknown function (DUF3617)
MMRSIGILLLGSAAFMLALSALRADEHTMRPGEYEMTTQMQMEGMNREIPPTTFRHCFSADDVKDWRRIAQENQRKSSDCEIKDMKTSGNHVSWSMTCKSGAKGTAEVEHRADGYDMTMNMETPGGSRGPMKMKMRTTAKRVGDCGK